MHITDANIFIYAQHKCYPIDRYPEFWEWLMKCGGDGKLKMPEPIFKELQTQHTGWNKWLKSSKVRNSIVLQEEILVESLTHVLEVGYRLSLEEFEQASVGQDPMLVAAAYQDKSRMVVTLEKRNPKLWQGQTKIPDACARIGIPCTNRLDDIFKSDPLYLVDPFGLDLQLHPSANVNSID